MRKILRVSALCCCLPAVWAQKTGNANSNAGGGVAVAVTHTQAILSYSRPNDEACQVEIREAGQTELVHDVNPTIFEGSNLDSRAGNVAASGDGKRVFVAGKRTAERGKDGRYYSRALQAFTDHKYQIKCGPSDVMSGEFKTANIPLGVTYNDPLPVDPKNPGQYAWPNVLLEDRSKGVIDPLTGMYIRRLTHPDEYTAIIGGTFQDALSTGEGTEWTNLRGALADDGDVAIYNGAGNRWMYLPMDFRTPWGGNGNMAVASVNILHVSFNAWAPKGSQGSPADERTLEACLTVNGWSCASAVLEAPLKECSSKCDGGKYRFVLGDPPPPSNAPPLSNWSRGFPIPPINANDLSRRAGSISRKGTTLRLESGNPFHLKWGRGTAIQLGERMFRIARVMNEESLELMEAPDGSETGIAYMVKSAGLLVRRKSSERGSIMVQFARWDAQMGVAAGGWDASGDGESFTNCSPVPVKGPNDEPGWHCHVSGGMYWIGRDSGTAIHFGRSVLPPKHGDDGWGNGGACNGGYWDTKDPNIFFCTTVAKGDVVFVRTTYHGSHEPIRSLQDQEMMNDCNGGREPCWDAENLTPGSKKRSLLDLLRAFHPDARNFKGGRVFLMGRAGMGRQFYLSIVRDGSSNDLIGYLVIFDADKREVIAAMPSWKTWPSRWATLHGGSEIGENDWVAIPGTWFRGPLAGPDPWAGNGPYYSRTTQPVSNQGEACPPRPANAVIPEGDWPAGNACVTFTVDGEPGDPTPAQYSAGTVSISGTSVKGTNTSWNRSHDGAQLKIGKTLYEFRYVSETEGRIDRPADTPVSDSPYSLVLERINHPGVGNPEHAYLQDAAEGDLFCGTDKPLGDIGTFACGTYLGQIEIFRLVAKNGKSWTMQRGYRKDGLKLDYKPLAQGAYLFALPSSCLVGGEHYCRTTALYWNFRADPYGKNAGGKTLLEDLTNEGGGHTTTRAAGEVNAVGLNCPKVDGLSYGCYNARPGGLLDRLKGKNFRITMNPPFAGLVGVGEPNSVDSHPSAPQSAASEADRRWFIDGRPFLGVQVSGTPQSPGEHLLGDLIHFKANQLLRLRRKVLPTSAFCGINPLLDVSGPQSAISGETKDAYKYCVANASGECRPGSNPGDAFVNCPQTTLPYCIFPGVNRSVADLRDVCLMDTGAYMQSITQIDYQQPDMTGKYGRILTHGLSRYRAIDIFWNAKTTPDGKWLLFRTPWIDGQRFEALLGKIPPFPEVSQTNRATFVPVPVEVKLQEGASHALVDFGYDPDFHCTSRQEACSKGSAAEFAFASEKLAPVACASGCKIEVPAISHRVLYYRVRYTNESGALVKAGSMGVTTVP